MLENGMLAAGKYQIIKLLGKGGTGSVYLVLDKSTGKTMAMKVLEQKDYWQEGKQEAWILRKIRHRRIPALQESFFWNGAFCLVMEYREGITLEQLVLSRGGLSEEEVLKLGVALCRILHRLHRRKQPIIYQDMKPSNLLCKGSRLSALVDFGCASEADRGGVVKACGRGTRGYAAPEQFQAGTVIHEEADIYALGCTLRYAWGSRRVSKGLEAVVRKCTHVRAEDRFASAGQVCRALILCGMRLLYGNIRKGTENRRIMKRMALFPAAAVLTLGGIRLHLCCLRQEYMKEALAMAVEMKDWGEEEALRDYLGEQAGFGYTRESLLKTDEQAYARLLICLGRTYWHQVGGTGGKLEGCRRFQEALKCEGLEEGERTEAACYGELLTYYERKRDAAGGTITDQSAGVEALYRLVHFLREQGGNADELLEAESELLRAVYGLLDKEAENEEMKSILLETKNYLIQEKNSFSREQRKKAEDLIDDAQELLRLR